MKENVTLNNISLQVLKKVIRRSIRMRTKIPLPTRMQCMNSDKDIQTYRQTENDLEKQVEQEINKSDFSNNKREREGGQERE